MFNGMQNVKQAFAMARARRESALTAAQEEQNTILRLRNGLVVLFGPFIGLSFVCLLPLIPIIMVLAMLPRIAMASGASDEAQMCLGCHSAHMEKVFANKEKLSVHVDEKEFAASVHKGLFCTNCHSDIQLDKHPSAHYQSRHDFALHVSKACRTCHDDRQLLAKPQHKMALNKANAPPCSDCHGAHSIHKVATASANISDYCLTCHQKDLSKMIGGEKVSLNVKKETLKASVHPNHVCTDCHATFSKTQHPVKEFKSKREHSIALSDACKRCHDDKAKQFEGSIHYKMLKSGNLSAPVCTDCHSSHSVAKKAKGETLAGVPCRNCHQGIFNLYKGSVHGLAKAGGNDKVPICSSCHFAHDVKAVSMPEKIKGACLGCHTQAIELHSKWLPNAASHMEAISCTVCHVPNEEKSIFLFISDNKGEQVGKPQVDKLLGKEELQSCEESGNCINENEFWSIYRKLNSEGSGISFTGRMKLANAEAAHSLALKKNAVRDCDKCHNANSAFFDKVKMAVVKTDGRTEVYNVDPKVLHSYMAILPLGKFYAIGSTRIKVLDYLGILFVAGGASFPAIHLTVRYLTRGIRRRRKGGHS